MEYNTVLYIGNRINDNVRFTKAASKKLTGIPAPFMKDALTQIVALAVADGITEIDEAYLEKVNAQRG